MFFGTFHNGLGEDLRASFFRSNKATGFSLLSLVLFCGDHLLEHFKVFQKMWRYGSQRSKAKRCTKRGQGRGHCDDSYMTTSRLSAVIYIRSQKEAWCANTLWFGTRDQWWMPFFPFAFSMWHCHNRFLWLWWKMKVNHLLRANAMSGRAGSVGFSSRRMMWDVRFVKTCTPGTSIIAEWEKTSGKSLGGGARPGGAATDAKGLGRAQLPR